MDKIQTRKSTLALKSKEPETHVSEYPSRPETRENTIRIDPNDQISGTTVVKGVISITSRV